MVMMDEEHFRKLRILDYILNFDDYWNYEEYEELKEIDEEKK
jgi:hypothetical protein